MGLSVALTALAAQVPIVAATKADKAAAVQNGLLYLQNSQQADGSWAALGYEQAATAAATFAILTQQENWGANAPQFRAAADKATDHLLATARVIDVESRNDGLSVCPAGSGSCKAIYWDGNEESLQTTGLIAQLIAISGAKAGPDVVAATNGPLKGMTWRQIAQGITNAVAASQSTRSNGDRQGGWHRIPGDGDSDSLNTQWAVTALLYDESLGAKTPQTTKGDLKIWLGNVQNASGAVCLQPQTEPCDHANTGGWLLAMRFAESDIRDARVQASVRFLNEHWQLSVNRLSYGHFGHPLAMRNVYMGLDATIGLYDAQQITNFLSDCGRSVMASDSACTWSEDYAQWLVRTQRSDGGWTGYLLWTDPLATAFSINILSESHVPSLPEPGTLESRHRTADAPQVFHMAASSTIAPMATDLTQSATLTDSLKRLRLRLWKGVVALAVDSAGTAIATATNDRVRIWAASTGLQRLSLSGVSGIPQGLAFTPDGTTLSGVGRDSSARLWSATTGGELARFTGHEHSLRDLAVSPDGRFLATAGEGTRIMLWDIRTRKLSKVLTGPTDFVNALAFSPDSKLLASADEAARVLIFDVATGKTLFVLRGHSGPIDTLAFSPDGTLLASGGQDSVIHVWDPAAGQQRRLLAGHTAPIRSLVFSPDSRTIASGGEDKQIMLWNASTGSVNRILSGSAGAINVLVFDPKAKFLASGTEASDFSLWNTSTGAKLFTISAP